MSGIRIFLTLVFVGTLLPCFALEWGDTRLSGFGTLGLVSSSNNDLIYRRDVTQKTGSYSHNIEWANDSLLALQADTGWTDHISTTAH